MSNSGLKGFYRQVVKTEARLKILTTPNKAGKLRHRDNVNHVLLLSCGHRVQKLCPPGARFSVIGCRECKAAATQSWGLQ